MKIRQIELIGFKSFADKTTLSLHNGITSIVGPNGCGKSNIVDSFRWVLGEQSAKTLRGEKMEEVIFQGTATKKQRGMAEVTLLLSQRDDRPSKDAPGNGNGESSEDLSADEMTVSRRLFRSGESEYLLNKRQCRLRDIKDIFLDTGLDVKSYSILDQGRIGEILNTKPQERRFLIEEVAGVMKYKVRKAEALSKLESSKQNLQRISDIVYEVKRQMNSLDRQVKRAERYKRLSSEVKEIDLRIAKREHRRLSESLFSLLHEIEKLRAIDSAKRGELSTTENAIERERLELLEKEKSLVELETSLHEKERAIADLEKEIALLKNNMQNKENERSRLIIQREEMDSRTVDVLTKSRELDAKEETILSTMEDLSGDLREKRGWLSNIEAAITDKEQEIENRRKELFTLSETLSNRKNDLHRLLSSRETLTYRESVSLKDIASVREGIGALRENIDQLAGEIESGREEQLSLQSEREVLKTGLSSLRDEIEAERSLLSAEKESLASNLSRLASLRELIVDASLRDFLSGSGEKTLSSGVVLSDIIATESEYEIALEAALSEKVNSLILEERDDLLSAIGIIREKHLSRTAILFTGLEQRPPDLPLESLPIAHASILGRATDFIRFENNGSAAGRNSAAREITRNLLRNTFIVDTVESAIELQRMETGGAFVFVTLDGAVITPEGFIFAGQGRDVLRRKREIKSLQRAVDEQQTAIRNGEEELETLTTAVRDKGAHLGSVETAIVEIEKKLSLLAHSLDSQRDDLERQGRKLASLDTEIATISLEKDSLKSVLDLKAEEIEGLEREKESIDEVITARQHSLLDLRNEHEEARTHFTDIKLAVAAYREKIDALGRERETMTALIADLDDKKEQALREIGEAEQRIRESSAGLERFEEEVKKLILETDKLRVEKSARKEMIASQSGELLAREGSLKKIRTEIDAVAQELGETNAKALEHRLKKENIENVIGEKHALDIGTVEIETAGFDPGEDVEKITQLQEKMRELGPVNLGTIEEYEELKTRYEFLSKQQQDLTLSIAELEEAISRINATTKRKLRDAYESLRTKFSEVFSILFGGGKADLILTDEENVLESGIEIIAQPPGKKLQNLNLLSGGEKALTSLALLFAGFLIKPSPLCILDEVDAPLDESNTVRFAQMIKGLSGETQFIVITHNRRSMEVSDYLYGVTMEEAGVSKVISLQFTEL